MERINFIQLLSVSYYFMRHEVYLEKKIRVLLLQALSRCSMIAVKAAPLKSIKLFVCGRLNIPACICRKGTS